MYDFDSIINRRGTDSVKWNVGQNELPLWIADMDFDTAPEIKEAIRERLDRGVFGYSDITDEWYEAITGWWKKRHGFGMKKDGLVFCTGVIPAISSAVRKLSTPAEKAVLLTPVYNIFYNSILNNGRNALECRLKYENGRYDIDFEQLEEKLADPQTSLLILCNPHNPVGRIWEKTELEKIGILAKRYGVTVISDEIHCDIVQPGKSYTPFISAGEACREVGIACISPTKAFNLAGIQTAAVYCENGVLRHKMWRALNTDEVAEPNSFAVPATVAAFTRGEKWLDELCVYLWKNRKTAEDYILNNVPQIKPVKAEATYLLWLDCTGLRYAGDLAEHIREKSGLIVNDGGVYGAPDGFLRMNLACPAAVLNDGLERLKTALT